MTTVRTTQILRDSDVIDLGLGQPGFDLLPLAQVREAAAARMAQGDTELLNYGYEQGDGHFRLALARFLQQQYGEPVSDGALMVTAGASPALDMLCAHLTRPGDTVFVEEPTYFLALRIFADRGLNVVGLPVDDRGLIVGALADALQEQQPAFLYTVPTFQNPSGATLPLERREELVALSREYDFFVVADEVYHLLNYTATPPRPMAAFTDGETVISLGSFSKILAPGLRLGWIQAAPSLLERFVHSGLLESGGGLNHFTSNLVRVLLERGRQESHLERLKATYQQRMTVMAGALSRHLGSAADFTPPDGGYYFWVRLPQTVDTAQLLERAHAGKVGFQPGANFSSGRALRHYVRLSVSFYDEARIEEGVERLGRVLADAI